ncbi:hypothetical protein OPIT5_17835 [Opitutaceae bacterium TAV5]|nr:hypothetical protein OPIT5_17835 [Opitutaceae bacterium TAV5]
MRPCALLQRSDDQATHAPREQEIRVPRFGVRPGSLIQNSSMW